MSFPSIGPGTVVGDWRVDRAIGLGASGVVYAAHNRHLPELGVALKVLSDPGDAQAVERLRREATLLARLDHPGIVRVRSMQVWEGHPCVVMDLAQGRPLQELVRRPPLSVEHVLCIVRQLAEALAYAHGEGIAHRDIKPSNAILEVSGQVRLLDFGIATHADFTRLTAVGGFGPATPAYAAPEWFDGAEASASAGDVYALGVLACELLTGRRAFSARGPDALAALRRAKVSAPKLDVGEGFAERVRSLVGDLTHRDPERRLTAAEASARLADARNSLAGLISVIDRTMDAPAVPVAIATVHGEQPTFDRYTLLEERGRGAMGIVYRAHDPQLQRDVALKLLIGGRLARGEPLDRFLNEARLAATLDHPHIVRVHEIGTHDDQLYFTMDFVEGPSLREWLAQHKRASPELAARWVAELGRAVAFAHDGGVIHRDIKPSNVVLEDSHARLTDFGLARRLGDHRLTASRIAVGTPAYMAPELRGGGRDADPKLGDVYALGALLFELCTGADLAGRSTTSSIGARAVEFPVWPRDVVGDVPRALEAIAVRATDPSPARRFASAREMVEHLETYLAGGRVDQRAIGPLRVLARWGARRRTELLAGGALAVGALAVGGGVVGLRVYADVRAESERSAAELDAVTVATEQGREALVEVLDSLTSDEARARAHSAIAETYRPHGATHVQRLEVEDRTYHLSRAWLLAPTQERLDAVLHGVEGLPAYEAVLSLVPEDARSPEQRWWAAVRAGDLGAASEMTELPRRAALARQLRGTRLGPPGQPWDIDGDGRMEINQRHAEQRVHSFALWAGDWVQHEGQLSIGLPDLPPIEMQTISPLRTVVTADVDGDGEIEAYVGLGHFDRTLTGFRRVDGAWASFAPSPEINAANSDINVIIPADLDGDGADELIVGMGPWNAYDIRVLDAGETDRVGDATRMAVSQRVRFGYTATGVHLPEAPALIAMGRTGDSEHDPAAAAVVVFDISEGELLAVAQFDVECRSLLSADVDADGQHDIICASGDYTIVWLRSGPASFERITLPGIVVWRADDLDGDGDVELVGFDVHGGEERAVAWGFGEGDEAARDLRYRGGESVTATSAWSRAEVLREVSPGAAADALLDALDEVPPASREAAREDVVRWYVEAGRPREAAAVVDPSDPRRRELLIAAGDVEALASMEAPLLRAVTPLSFASALSEAWDIHDPFAIQRDPVAEELVVSGAGKEHLLASLRLRPTEGWKGWAAVVVPFHVVSNEQGSNLAIRLRRADGSSLDMVVSHETSNRSGAFTCADREQRDADGQVAVLITPDGDRCQGGAGLQAWDATSSPPVALEFWAKGRERLPNLPIGRLRVGEIMLYNLLPEPVSGGSSRLARLVADGRAAEVVEGFEPTAEGLLAAAHARALAEQRQVREASAALLRAKASVPPETWLGWRRLALRNPGPLRTAAREALGEAYWPAMVDAWQMAMLSPSRSEEVQGSLAGELSGLDMVDPRTTPDPAAISRLLEWRGMLAMRRGQLNAARVDIERALPLAEDARRQRDMRVLLVQIAAQSGRLEEARERAERAVAASPTPLLTRDRTDDILRGAMEAP